MREWRKYEKTFRLSVPQYDIPLGKFGLTDSLAKALLTGNVIITEKMDGANCGIFKSKGEIFFQKRGGWMDESHEQFKYFKNRWRWDKYETIEKLPNDSVIYGELLYCTHSIYYDKLPDFFLVFDVFDLRKNEYLNWCEVEKISKEAGLFTVPYITTLTNPTRQEIGNCVPKESKYGNESEGIVIHNYSKQLRAKVVKPAFIKFLDEGDHWANQEIRYNRLFSI